MAVLEVTRKWSTRQGGVSTSDRKSYTLSQGDVYQVTADPQTSIFEVLSHQDVPKAGDIVPGSPFVWVRDVKPKQVSPILWEVGVNWSGTVGPAGPEDSPLNQPPKVQWGDVETNEAVDEDINGNPIVTVNNEPISGVTIPVPDQTVTITRNFATINTYAIGAYRRAVNSDNFLGWPPGTARITKFGASNQYDDDLGYWVVTATIQFRIPYRTTAEKAWYARVLHQGYLVKDSTTGDIRHAVDDNEQPVTKPVLLKADGTRETDPANAHWLEFQRFNTLPFSSLGLL